MKHDKSKFNVIAAVDENMCLGKNGVLPWNLPTEFQYFLSMTSKPEPELGCLGLQNAIIIGRKTWQTMDQLTSKPFPKSLNIVLSRSVVADVENYHNTVVARSISDAMDIVKKESNIDEVWVLGGSEAYSSALQSPHFYRLYLTHIHAKFDCDTYFPIMRQELEFGQNFKRIPQNKINDPRVPIGIQEDSTTGVQFDIRVYGKRELQTTSPFHCD